MRDAIKLTALAAALAIGAASLAQAGGGAYMGGGGGGGGGRGGGGGGYSGGGGGGYAGGGGGYGGGSGFSSGGSYGGGSNASGGAYRGSPGYAGGRSANSPAIAPSRSAGAYYGAPQGPSQSAGTYSRGAPPSVGYAGGSKPLAGQVPGSAGYAGAPSGSRGYTAAPGARWSKPLVTQQGGARYSPGLAVNGGASKPRISGGTSRPVSPGTKPFVSGGVNSMPGAGPMRGARPPGSWNGNHGWNNGWHSGNRWHGGGWWGWNSGWRGGWWGPGWWGPSWGWWGPTWSSWWWGPGWGLGWWGPGWNAGWWGVPGFSIVIPISAGGATVGTTIIEQPQGFVGEGGVQEAPPPDDGVDYRLYCPPSDAFHPHVQNCTQPWVKVPVPRSTQQDGSNRAPPPDAPAGSLPPGASPAPRNDNGYAPQGGATTVPYSPARPATQRAPAPYEVTASLDDAPRAMPVSAILASGYADVVAQGDGRDTQGTMHAAQASAPHASGARIPAPRMTPPGERPTTLASTRGI